jgi:molecular chaperone GrpE (heat shock protein)
MSPTERIILSHKAWRKAASMLRQRCLRLQHRLDTQDQTPGRILADEVERLQEVERRRSARKHRDRDTIARLQTALDSANERCNRIQADGNALAEQLHAWRQACQDHGIQPTPEALRAVLRRVDAACVAEADL